MKFREEDFVLKRSNWCHFYLIKITLVLFYTLTLSAQVSNEILDKNPPAVIKDFPETQHVYFSHALLKNKSINFSILMFRTENGLKMPFFGDLISDTLRILGNRSVTQPQVTPPSNRALVLIQIYTLHIISV